MEIFLVYQYLCRKDNFIKNLKIRINKEGNGINSYDEFVTYTGNSATSTCGISFGPEGLYFSNLHDGNIYLVKPRKDYNFNKEAVHVFA